METKEQKIKKERYKLPKYEFILPCEIYDCHCFYPKDIVKVEYVNISADNCKDVFVIFKNKEYSIPVDVFLLCTKKLKESKDAK